MPIPLSIILFDRGINGAPTTNNPINLAGRAESYEDALSDRYGFETARVAWTPTWAEVEEWARYDHLLRPMVAYTPDARIAWEGFLAEIEISIGTKKIAFSLKDMANRLVVRYSEPGGAQGESGTYSNAASQALFGIKDRVINAAVALSAAASNQAQTVLAAIAYPRSKQSSSAGTTRGELSISLTFWGKYALLDWLLTASTSTTSTQTSTQIASLLASYATVNAFFSASAANITATGVSDTEYIEPDTTYREKIERLLARGNSSQQPLAWGFYEGGVFTVAPRASATPHIITYYESEASGQIRDQWQNVLDVWDVRPNAMAQIVDLIDAPTPGSVETPLRKYVARVTRSVRGEDVTVTLEPDDTENLEDLLTSPAGAGPAGTSERQAAFERKVTAPARSVFSATDNDTRYDRGTGVWKPAAGGTGKANTGTIDTGGRDITYPPGTGTYTGVTGSGTTGALAKWTDGAGGTLGNAVAGSDYVAPGSLNEAVDDRVAALLIAGNLITLTYNDAGNSLTIAVSSLNETIDDRVAALLVAGTGISLSYNDAGNALTISNTGGTVGGTGTAGRLMQWASGGADAENSTLAKTGAGVLTLSVASTQTITIGSGGGTLNLAGGVLTLGPDLTTSGGGSGITLSASGAYTLTIPKTGSAIVGTGGAIGVAYFSDSNTITSSNDFQFDTTNSTLTVRDQILVEGSGAGYFMNDQDGSGQWGMYVDTNTWRVSDGVAQRLTVNTSNQLAINGTQVLTTRRTGWAAATGTATRSTFATSTVTTAVLAEHVKALIDDLITHGIIGT